MQHKTFKFFEWSFFIIAGLILLLAIALTIARFTFPKLNRYQPQLAAWASKEIGEPVSISGLDAKWIGLTPSFGFKDISIVDKNTHKPILIIKHFYIKFNLLRSLWYWRAEPSLISIDGVELNIKQNSSNNYTVNGYNFNYQLNAADSTDGELHQFIRWLLNQEKVSLGGINVTWQPLNGVSRDIPDLRLELINQLLSHKLLGAVNLPQNTIKPLQLKWIIEFKGSVFVKSSLRIWAYISAQNAALNQWLPNKAHQGLALQNGLADLQVWGKIDNWSLTSLQTEAAFNNLALSSTFSDGRLLFSTLAGNFYWQRLQNGWALAANQVQVKLNNQSWPIREFSFQYYPQTPTKAQTQILQANDLSLAAIVEILLSSQLLPPKEYQQLKSLQPTGNITNLMVQYTGDLRQFGQLALTANFSQLGINRWQNIPGITGLSGWVAMTPTAGKAKIASENLKLDFGNVFLKPIDLSYLRGDIQWNNLFTDNWQVAADDLAVGNNDVTVRGNFKLNNATAGPELNALASFAERDFSKVKYYLPFGIMRPHLASWLKSAFIAGGGLQGTIVFRGPLHAFPFDQNQGVFTAEAKFNNLDFNYHAGWPSISKLTGELVFNDRSMKVSSHQGVIENSAIQQVSAEIADLAQPVLMIDGKVTADAQNGMKFIQQSPLNEKIGKALRGINLQGPINLALQLKIPLDEHHTDSDEVKGQVSMTNNALSIPDMKININKLSGNFQFTDDGIWAKTLQGEYMQEPISLSITTQDTAKKEKITKITSEGRFSISELRKIYPFDFLNYLSGAGNFQGLYQIRQIGAQETFSGKITSDLKGIAVDLPPPFKKSASATQNFQLSLAPTDIRLLLQVELQNNLAGIFGFTQRKDDWELQRATLSLGGGSVALHSQPGLYIQGRLNQFNWHEWQPYIERYQQKKKPNENTETELKLRQINLQLGSFSGLGLNLKDLKLLITPELDRWLIHVDSNDIAGKISLSTGTDKRFVQARLSKFNYSPTTQKTHTVINPAAIPQLDIIINQFQYGQRRFGTMELATIPRQSGMRIDHLIIQSKLAHLSLVGNWENTRYGQATRVYGRLQSNNLGKVLQSWDITNSLANGKGNAALTLNWAGSPFSPSVGTLNGKLSMEFHNGRIINIGQKAEAEMGLGRILTLLSLQTLPRRLSLNFSDLTKKGFSFDVMRGNFNFIDGNAFTKDFLLNGPVARVSVQGRIGFKVKDYDFELTILPYITSSLPIIATIAGGPIVGAVAWVANKVFGREISKIAESKYRVVGSWVQPEFMEIPAPNYRQSAQQSSGNSQK